MARHPATNHVEGKQRRRLPRRKKRCSDQNVARFLEPAIGVEYIASSVTAITHAVIVKIEADNVATKTVAPSTLCRIQFGPFYIPLYGILPSVLTCA